MSSGKTFTRAEFGLGTEVELQRRLSLVTPAETVRGMAFHTSLNALRAELGEESLARCLEPLKEKSYKSFFTYPVSEYLRLQYSTAWLLSRSTVASTTRSGASGEGLLLDSSAPWWARRS